MNQRLLVIMTTLSLTLSPFTFAGGETPTASTDKLGGSFALSFVPFIGGDSGPTTLLSETDYSDSVATIPSPPTKLCKATFLVSLPVKPITNPQSEIPLNQMLPSADT